MYQLRQYQIDLTSRIAQSWFEHGNRRVLCQLPTGGGKSVLLSSIVQSFNDRGMRVLVLAHRAELVNQLIEKIESIVNEPVGVIKAGIKPNLNLDIQVGSVQSAARRLDSYADFDLIIIDECFPAGTLVDGKPIESLQVGDLVNSFNEVTGQIEQKPIVRLFKKLSNSKVFVNAGGIKIECTEEHPFYTQRGWIAANQLTTKDYLYVQNQLPKLPERIQNASSSIAGVSRERDYSVLFQSMSEELQISASTPPTNQAVRGMFGRFFSNIELSTSNQESVLLDRVQQKEVCASVIENNGGYKSQTRISQNDCKQSDEQFGISIEDVRYVKENRTQAIGTGREWQGRDSSTANIVRCADGRFKRMGDGINSQHQPEEGQRIPLSLQNRYCESIGKNSSGSRWGFSSVDRTERTGFEENGTLEWVSVESVEVYQQAGNGGLGERYVYNIEVLDNHNYFVESVLVHNCHHTVSKSYTNILDRYPTAKVLGVTATPIRLDGKGFRGVFDDLICGVSVTELIETGSLSAYKYYGAERMMSVLGVGKKGGDFATSGLEAENPSEIVANQVIEAYRRHLHGKQSVIFAISVGQSIAIAQALNSVGIITHHLDGMTDSGERKSTMQLFRDKKIQCLTNCALFDEGLDIPSLDGVILARPTASLSRFLQMAGRALRVADGKEHAVIIDLAGNYERLGMPSDEREWTLDGIEKKKRDKKGEKVCKRNEITNEIELVSIFDTGTQFIEIAGTKVVMTAELNHWIELCDGIIAEQVERGYKAAWCAHRMMASDLEPPIEAWKYLGKKLGYHYAWAKYKQEEWMSK
jgi:superfamily II DNA or RNA helicase